MFICLFLDRALVRQRKKYGYRANELNSFFFLVASFRMIFVLNYFTYFSLELIVTSFKYMNIFAYSTSTQQNECLASKHKYMHKLKSVLKWHILNECVYDISHFIL